MYDSSFGRLLGVLVAPGQTFRSIAQRPTWVVPLVVLVLLLTTLNFLVFQRIDLQEMMRQQMAEQGQEMPPEMEQSGGLIQGCYTVAAVGGVLFLVFAGAAVFLAFNLFGGQLRYVTSLSVFVHSLMPVALSALLALPVVLSRESLSLEEVQSGGLLPSNLAAFAPEDAGRQLVTFLSLVDFFWLWALGLWALGYHVAARVSKGAAAGLVVGFYLLLVLILVALVGLAPGGTG